MFTVCCCCIRKRVSNGELAGKKIKFKIMRVLCLLNFYEVIEIFKIQLY